jgi:hypothetical protein
MREIFESQMVSVSVFDPTPGWSRSLKLFRIFPSASQNLVASLPTPEVPQRPILHPLDKGYIQRMKLCPMANPGLQAKPKLGCSLLREGRCP